MQEIVKLLRSKIDDMLENELSETILTTEQNKTPSIPSPQDEKKIQMRLEEILKPLQEVDGYLASALFDMGGEILVKHNNSKYNVEMIGANAVAMINTAAGLGKCNFIQVNSDLGIFGAVWAVEDQSIVAVLLEPNAYIGLAKKALLTASENAKNKLL